MAPVDTVLDVGRFATTRRAALRGVLVVVAGAALFFAALGALPHFRGFIAGPGDGTLTGAALEDFRRELLPDHHTEVVLGYVLIGLGQLLLGIGTSIVAAGLARLETAWRAGVARGAAGLCLLGGVLSALAYAWPGYWTNDAAMASLGEGTVSTLTFLAGWAVLAAGLMGIAIVLLSGSPWPRWTGVALLLFSALPFVTLLPLFFQVGAVVAGVGVAVGLRPARLARLTAAQAAARSSSSA